MNITSLNLAQKPSFSMKFEPNTAVTEALQGYAHLKSELGLHNLNIANHEGKGAGEAVIDDLMVGEGYRRSSTVLLMSAHDSSNPKIRATVLGIPFWQAPSALQEELIQARSRAAVRGSTSTRVNTAPQGKRYDN